MGTVHLQPTATTSSTTTTPTMLLHLVLLTLASASPLHSGKAASPYTNLGCQCSSLTFVDSGGRVQGNCQSADSTGALWCYTSGHSSCQDLAHSARFPANPWSYQACATPAYLPSHQPAYLPSHHVPILPSHQPAYTAPAHHAPVCTAPAYTAPAHHVPAYTAPDYHAPAHHLPTYQQDHAYSGVDQSAGPFAVKAAVAVKLPSN